MIDACLWPRERLGAALAVLARHAGLADGARVAASAALAAPPGAGVLDAWLSQAAAGMALEAQPVQCNVPEVDALLARSGPALLQVADAGFVLLLGRRGAALRVVGPDLRDMPRLTDHPLNRVLVAGRLFGVRLIDNMPLTPAPTSAPV